MSVFVPIPCCFDYCSFATEVWKIMPQALLFFFLGFLWWFWIFCGFIQILGLFVLVLWKMSWVFWQGLQYICRLLLTYHAFNFQNHSVFSSLFPSLCTLFLNSNHDPYCIDSMFFFVSAFFFLFFFLNKSTSKILFS